MSGALAIFAKTKSLSPVKTRLANDIGAPLAEEFYILSVEATAEIVSVANNQVREGFATYWALAEEKAANYKEWQNFSTLWTGDGDFGARLHHIYSTLLKKHDYVILIGTDSPQLEPELITHAIEKIHEHPNDCIIGPAFDGGFYLFAAKIAIAEHIWKNVSYSQSDTLKQLSANLASNGIAVQLLPEKGDVDVASDLEQLKNALKANHNRLSAQQKLYGWLDTYL